jgi:hypothetical protein
MLGMIKYAVLCFAGTEILRFMIPPSNDLQITIVYTTYSTQMIYKLQSSTLLYTNDLQSDRKFCQNETEKSLYSRSLNKVL